jgi:site-specific recombinase XerD
MTGPQTLTTLQANSLLDSLLDDKGTYKRKVKGTRNYLIGLLMLDAGLRVGEVCQLLITDLWLNDEPRHSLLVREDIAKNKSVRVIPLSGRIRKATCLCEKWYWNKHLAVLSGFAFFAAYNSFHLTDRQVERIIGHAGEKAFGRWVNPHVLRHTFATNLMRTCSSRVVQELLGHKHLASTQIYTHPNQQDLTDAIESLNNNQQKTSQNT